MRLTIRHLGSALLLGAASATSLAAQGAQGTVQVTPFVGMYAPANDVAKISAGGLALSVKHKTALIAGGNARYWLSPQVGIEGTAAYTTSKAEMTAGIGGLSASQSESGNVFLASVKALLRVTPNDGPISFTFGAGPALVKRGGTAYKDFTLQNAGTEGESLVLETKNLTDFGGVLSVGARYRVNDLFGLRLGVEDYLYQTKLRTQDKSNPANVLNFDSKFQNDFVFAFGVSIGIVR